MLFVGACWCLLVVVYCLLLLFDVEGCRFGCCCIVLLMCVVVVCWFCVLCFVIDFMCLM